MVKDLNIFTTLCSISLFILAIVFISVLSSSEDDYKFDDNEQIIGLLTFISFFNSFRTEIVILLYIYFFIPFFFLYICADIFYGCLCVHCCIKPQSYYKAKRTLKKNLCRNTTKFLGGSLDIFHMFFCFKNCMPKCVDSIQPCLDVLGLCLDVCLLLVTFSLAIFLATQRKSGGNAAPVVCFFLQCLPLAVILLVNVIRFRRNRNVSARVRDIFRVEDNVNVRVFYEDSIGGKECPFDDDCENTEPKHRVKYHKREDVFKLEKFDENNNIVVGFHQTSIENVKLIIKSTIRPSSEGWIGSGIYFATNFAATENKANNKGATLVARIHLGKVEELEVKPSRRSAIGISDGYNSRYLHHDNGPKSDEFIIRDASQIEEYVVVVSKSAVKEYRERFTNIW